MGSAFAAGAGADALEDVLRRKFAEVQANRQYQLQQQQFEEQRKLREAAQQQQSENASFLNDQRAAAAAKLRTDADAKTARDQQVQAFLADPNLSPAVRQWAQGAALGFNQLNVHDYETPEAHRAHLDLDAQRKRDEDFEQHKRIRDYDNAHPAPVRIPGARPATDDPSLPIGSQLYLTQIATKHPNDINAAMAELNTYLSNPQTRTDHPHLSPVKATDTLRRIMGARSGSSGGDELDALISQAMNAPDGSAISAAGSLKPPLKMVNGRLVGQSGRGSLPAVADIQLAERARAVLQQRGYATTPENIQKFLSIPSNRQLLATGGQ